MSYIYQRTYTRPNLGVSFYKPDPSVPAYTKTKFIDVTPPKLVTQSLSISADTYTLTRTMEFTDQAAFNEWNTDPVIVANNQLLIAFNAQNGIIDTVVSG